MTFTKPVPFAEAVNLQAVKTALPMTLTSAQYRALGPAILNQATFAARVLHLQTLDQLGGLIQDVLGGAITPSRAAAEMRLFQQLLDDPLSDGRVARMVTTATEIAQGRGQFIAANNPDIVDAFPAWEYVRFEDRKDPRDWPARWNIAAVAGNDAPAARVLQETGRMIALKSSALWQHLGADFDDGIDNPFPPFAWGSGMGVIDAGRSDCIEVGLITADDLPAPADVSSALAPHLEATYEFRSAALRDALLARGDLKFTDGVLSPQ